MAIITTRADLKEYCLRRLGKPVIEINVDPQQLEDRIDDAFLFFKDYHFSAVERVYLKHQITSQDIANEYIDISVAAPQILSVVKMFRIRTGSSSMFNVQYQTLLNQMYSIGSIDLAHYDIMKSYMELVQQFLTPEKSMRFNRYDHKIHIDTNWQQNLIVGDWIVIDCWKAVDPEEVSELYNDRFLKEYTTALFKRQWGENLKKYAGIQLLGGVTLDGQKLYDEAVADIQRLEEQVHVLFVEPPEPMLG